MNLQSQIAVGRAEQDLDLAGVTMARDVGHGLLHDAEHAERMFARNACRRVKVGRAAHAGAALKVGDEGLEGRPETKLLETEWAQRGAQGASLLNSGVDDVIHADQVRAQRREGVDMLAKLLREPVQIELERGEALAKLIVQFARDVQAFFFDRMVEMAGVLAQGLARVRQRLLRDDAR